MSQYVYILYSHIFLYIGKAYILLDRYDVSYEVQATTKTKEFRMYVKSECKQMSHHKVKYVKSKVIDMSNQKVKNVKSGCKDMSNQK